MTKEDFIKEIANSTGFTNTDSRKALNAVLENITNVLAKGDSIAFVGFGTFKISERSARPGRNPRTGEVIQIAASKAPVFKAGKDLKSSVN